MRSRRYYILLFAAAFVAAFLLLAGRPALATNADVFTITGGTTEQQQLVRDTLEISTWDWTRLGSDTTSLTLTDSHPPHWGTDVTGWDISPADTGELAFPLIIAGATLGVSYWPSGNIYIDSRISDDRLMRQVVMHEAAHARVMFVWFWDNGGQGPYQARALLAWQQLAGAGDFEDWYRSPIENHAEWFRVTYLDPSLQSDPTPNSYLPGPPNGTVDVIAFHDEWAPRVEPEPPEPLGPTYPFPDIQPGAYGVDQELLDASLWAVEQGIFEGYGDGSFGVFAPVLMRHVALVCDRTGIYAPPWHDLYGEVTRAEVKLDIPGLTWEDQDRWDEPLLRSQLLRLMYRARDGIDEIAAMGDRLEKWFSETRVTWQGVTRAPRLIGYGTLMVALSRETGVPLWLALGQGWLESQWGTTGLAINHNMIWGVKDVSGKYGVINGIIRGFADYISVEENIRAYYRLIANPDGPYWRRLQAGDIRGLISIYAPASDGNDVGAYYRTVQTVKRWTEERGLY